MRTYKDDLPQRLPLSQQKEFKRIKNIIIEEAARLGDAAQVAEVVQPVETEQPHRQATGSPARVKAPAPGQLFNSTSSLLYHMGRIFQQQRQQPITGMWVAVDSKLKQKIREKKIAMGHKPDDHEDQEQAMT